MADAILGGAGGDRPNLEQFVARPGEESIAEEREARHGPFVTRQFLGEFTGDGVVDAYGAVGPGGGHRAAIAAVRRGPEVVFRFGHRPVLVGFVQRPEADAAVFAPGGDLLAVGADRDRADQLDVPLEDALEFPGRDVPHDDGVVAAGRAGRVAGTRDQRGAVFGHREAVDRGRVPLEFSDDAGGGEAGHAVGAGGQFDFLILPGGEHAGAVAGEGEGVRRAAVRHPDRQGHLRVLAHCVDTEDHQIPGAVDRTDGFIGGRIDNLAERHVLVVGRELDFLIGHVPEEQLLVVAGGGELVLILPEGDADHVLFVAFQRVQFLAGLRVPNVDVQRPARRGPGAVRAEGHAGNAEDVEFFLGVVVGEFVGLVPAVGQQFATVADVPEAHGAVFGSGREPLAVRAVRQRVDAVAVPHPPRPQYPADLLREPRRQERHLPTGFARQPQRGAGVLVREGFLRFRKQFVAGAEFVRLEGFGRLGAFGFVLGENVLHLLGRR